MAKPTVAPPGQPGGGPEAPSPKQSGVCGCLARVFWMLLGNVALVFCAVFIARGTAGFLSAADIVFWIAVAAMLAVRYVDIARLGGSTVTGKPAELRDWPRYAGVVSAYSLGLWLAAHGLALWLK